MTKGGSATVINTDFTPKCSATALYRTKIYDPALVAVDEE